VQATRDELWKRLEPYQQQHLLQFWHELSVTQRQRLASQIAEIDLDLMRRLATADGGHEEWQSVLARAESPPAFRLGESDQAFSRPQARQAAEQLLADGRVGAILVAGGQGTRLGYPHPKGMYRIGPVSQRSLFQMHIEQLRAVALRYGRPVPLFLMTSPATHDETIEFLERHERFGLAAEDLHVFCQGTMPAIDDQGRLLLEAKDQVFLSPDGHGGMLAALVRSGGLARAQQLGLEALFYFQVDNPLVSICDRELVGFHALADSDMSTLVVAKQAPTDKVGNVVSVDGRLMVVEYSDLPAEAAARRDAQGGLLFWAGSIAVHVFRVDFLRRAAGLAEALPFHRARKKVPYVNQHGALVSPPEANATKFEKFIFDLMPLARNAIVVEGDAREIFAPLKNASGAPSDTPETTRTALSQRAARWLREAGGALNEGVVLEISPFVALDAEQLRGEIAAGTRIERDTYLQLLGPRQCYMLS
jgi:UDP-N-acetylglucosamine/UDP-N-acetylgalactosamine diphosphorylase